LYFGSATCTIAAVTWGQQLIQAAASLAWWQIALVGSAGILVIAFVVMVLFETASDDFLEFDDREQEDQSQVPRLSADRTIPPSR
jgi:hypothetical protein